MTVKPGAPAGEGDSRPESEERPHDHHDHHHPHSHHRHGHRHGPADSSGSPAAHRAALAEGAGPGRLLFLDAASGIAGDMTIAALVDLGVPFAVVQGAVSALPLEGVQLELRQSMAGAIGATSFDVRFDPSQPERGYAEIDAMISGAPIEDRVRSLARKIFRVLAEAESEVHRIDIADVHFHEVGAVDAIVDVVGAAACFAYLGADVVASPLPMGRGSVECRHGRLPLPAPATVRCLRGVPTYDSGIDAELVTPTGAALVAGVAGRLVRGPAFAPDRIGWGGGTRTLPDRPNALRAILGDPVEVPAVGAEHVVVEANVDDMTGELAAHAIEALLAAGALDAWASPITMKKGRPAFQLGALVRSEQADRVAEVMLRETTTIGVRRSAAWRTERPRRVVDVETGFGAIPVKVSEGPYGPPQMKPEFDACARAAADAGVPVREVIAAALNAARRSS